MDEDQQFCLRWNNHQSTLISVFDTLLEKGTLVDCTLAAEGQFLKAHKVVLSACSPYFAALLSQQYDKHPIFILKDVKFQELRAMMDYMYRGEVNISQDQLAALLKAAESLQIKGLSDSSGGRNNGTQSSHSKDTTAANKNASSKGSGLTIEQKMPRLAGQAAAEGDADLSEGSASPNARKRKKVRRRSIETNNVDNHDHHSNSSSHSMPHGGAAATQQQSQPQQQTASTMPTNITSATSSANVLSVTKKTDQEMRKDVEMDETDDQQTAQQRPAKEVQRQNNGGRKSISSSAATPGGKATTGQDLIEPKNEYDESNEETVEDLTLDEEEIMEELDQAGPSHGGEGSSQGYPQWPVDRSQDNEAFMSGQDAAGHHRDTQGEEELTCTPMIYMNDSANSGNRDSFGELDNGQRFFCSVCDKSYLRKRHLQRHMRDECIGIPPRFQCSMCTSKFRRKYHLVRHLNSKHAVIVTKENELELVRSKSSELRGSKRMKMEPLDEAEYLMKQEKLFTENNFFNNDIFTRAMNMIMPKTEHDPNSKIMPIIDTNQLLQSLKQQQQSLMASGVDLTGLPSSLLPTMPQFADDPELYARLMNFKKMAVNAMGTMGGHYDDTDCESDDVQDLRIGSGGGSSVGGEGRGRSVADSDDMDRDKEDRMTPNGDDFHMKMNIELRPDYLGNGLCGSGETNQKSQIIPNDTMN